MLTLDSVAAVRAQVVQLRQRGTRIGFVPTMGALHAGHLSLVAAARQRGEAPVVSIFVNPTQFGPNEDLARYPRTLAADTALLQAAGAQVLFTPTPETMYQPGEDLQVRLPALSSVLEGASRPGHFDGVALVVAKLLNIVQPDTAYFGQKDFQQTVVVRRLVRDLFLPVTVSVQPTTREPDGLAMSSRNRYLGPAERAAAPQLYQALLACQAAAQAGSTVAEGLAAFQETLLAAPAFRLDYVQVVHAETLAPVAAFNPDDAPVVVAAAYLGATRLIDNLPVFG